MRHGKKINHLGRTQSHRKALLSNMAASLILHKRINTTLAKAKALRKYVEPILTRGKDDSTHSRRTVFSYLQDKDAVIKIENRPGDNAEMCMMELVDFNTIYGGEGKASAAPAKKATRRSGGAKKKATDDAAETAEPKAAKKPAAAKKPKADAGEEAPKKAAKKKKSDE